MAAGPSDRDFDFPVREEKAGLSVKGPQRWLAFGGGVRTDGNRGEERG
jgi:hypothetical protein